MLSPLLTQLFYKRNFIVEALANVFQSRPTTSKLVEAKTINASTSIVVYGWSKESWRHQEKSQPNNDMKYIIKRNIKVHIYIYLYCRLKMAAVLCVCFVVTIERLDQFSWNFDSLDIFIDLAKRWSFLVFVLTLASWILSVVWLTHHYTVTRLFYQFSCNLESMRTCTWYKAVPIYYM